MEAKEREDLRSLLAVILNKNIDSAFSLAHDFAKTESGDITPEQREKLDNLSEELLDLIMEQTLQNLPEALPEEGGLYEWEVPVCRIGYSHRTIVVSAPDEEMAIERAVEEAGGESFSENISDYQAPDGAIKLRKL
jgi:hypothetical protein